MAMRIARFIHLAEAHGGDLGRWPAAEREAARELLAWSDEAPFPADRAQGFAARRVQSIVTCPVRGHSSWR